MIGSPAPSGRDVSAACSWPGSPCRLTTATRNWMVDTMLGEKLTGKSSMCPGKMEEFVASGSTQLRRGNDPWKLLKPHDRFPGEQNRF